MQKMYPISSMSYYQSPSANGHAYRTKTAQTSKYRSDMRKSMNMNPLTNGDLLKDND